MVFKMIRHVIIKTCPMRLNENLNTVLNIFSKRSINSRKFSGNILGWYFSDIMVTEYRDLQNLNLK